MPAASNFQRGERIRLYASALLGVLFFLAPIPIDGKATVLFDIIVKAVLGGLPTLSGLFCLSLIFFGTFRYSSSFFGKDLKPTLALVLRWFGLFLSVVMFFNLFPYWLGPKITQLMWDKLILSVGVIIPIGAVIINILVHYGCLEFVGVLMQPIMRPLFRLPGRSALDDLTSWLGSYSVGLYLTRKLLDEGLYQRREAFTILVCFSTVSVGFVGVVASTLGILHLFPLVMLSYFLCIYLVAIVLVRIWPITSISPKYLKQSHPEKVLKIGWQERLRIAHRSALETSKRAPSLARVIRKGLLDGLRLASDILATILAIGTLALLFNQSWPGFFQAMGAPMVPVLSWLGIAEARQIAPAIFSGITEMYVPALLVKESVGEAARFFVAVLSISQLIFFSSVGPMMLEMFRDIPVRFSHLVALFFIRTLLIIPILAALVHLYQWMGLLAS